MTGQPCPGPENRRYRDAWKAHRQALAGYDPLDAEQSRPEPPDIDPWPGAPVWCADCASAIGRRLAELDDLAGRLAAEADGYSTSTEAERIPGSGEPASPSQAADDLNEMHVMLSGWETIYRELEGWLSAPPRGDLARRETACIDWLRRHLRSILVSDIAADFGTEILQWHTEFCASAKAGVRTLRKPLRCPSCRMFSLFWTEGEQHVYCRNEDGCGRVLSLAEYEADVERVAGEQHVALVAAAGVDTLTSVPDSHVRKPPAPGGFSRAPAPGLVSDPRSGGSPEYPFKSDRGSPGGGFACSTWTRWCPPSWQPSTRM